MSPPKMSCYKNDKTSFLSVLTSFYLIWMNESQQPPPQPLYPLFSLQGDKEEQAIPRLSSPKDEQECFQCVLTQEIRVFNPRRMSPFDLTKCPGRASKFSLEPCPGRALKKWGTDSRVGGPGRASFAFENMPGAGLQAVSTLRAPVNWSVLRRAYRTRPDSELRNSCA